MKKYVYATILFLFLIFVTYFFVLREADFSLLFQTLKNVSLLFLVLTFILVFIYVFLGSFFLKRILYHFKYHISMSSSFGYLFTEVLFSAITPSSLGGQPMQIYEMKKDDVPYEVSGIMALFNAMLNRLALCLIATVLLISFRETVFSLNNVCTVIVLLGYFSTLLLISFYCLLLFSKKVCSLACKIAFYFIDHLKLFKKKEELKEKVKNTLDNYQECSKIIKSKPVIFFEGLGILILQRVAILLASYTVYKSFGLNEYPMLLILSFQVCITLGSDLMPTPGGVLVNESLNLVVNEFLYGPLTSVAAMLILRSFTFYLLVLVSAIIFYIFHYQKRKKAVYL